MSPVLAVDWGTRRVGLAISDPSRRVARALPTLLLSSPDQAATRIAETAAREGVTLIVVGLPLHASGEEGNSARRARRLGDALRGMGYDIEFVDERWTSEEARELAIAQGERRGRKERLDQLAALLMLQHYLDAGKVENGHA
ncbi:MAG TPA: Holliday junction resolvase RuvX [Candidatus Eisenbacteria bacterium]|nr:Holliday junction resolvase RuvX [Candidatus Eisenbacteria bacterium]